MCSKKFTFSRYGCILVKIKDEVRATVSPCIESFYNITIASKITKCFITAHITLITLITAADLCIDCADRKLVNNF